MNLFAGSRRVAIVAAVAWTAFQLDTAFREEPHAWVTYSIAGLGYHAVPVEHCGDGDAQAVVHGLADGKVMLCFVALPDAQHGPGIPYQATFVELPDRPWQKYEWADGRIVQKGDVVPPSLLELEAKLVAFDKNNDVVGAKRVAESIRA